MSEITGERASKLALLTQLNRIKTTRARSLNANTTMKIKTLNPVRFNALCFSRQPLADFISEEVEWFSDENEHVLGIVLLDLVDSDWSWVVLGRDANSLFRAVDLQTSISSKDEARKQLHARLLHHASAGIGGFVQGDERKTTTRLFEPKVPVEREHYIFKLIKSGAHHSAARALMQEIANAFVDVDGNYVKDFQTTGFNARLWELYLFAFLHEQRFYIHREVATPDFCLVKGDIPVAVEAVTVNPTEGETAPIPTSEEQLKHLREEYMPIKFGSALFSKLKKRYWELPHVKGKPLVLAIHDFHSNNSMTWSAPSLNSYLYGLRATWQKDESGKLTITENKVEKHTWGSKAIPSGFFDQPGAENISAVLFSNSATISKFNRMGKLAGFGDPKVTMIRVGVRQDFDPNATEPLPFKMLIEPDKCHETWSEGVSIFHNPKALLPIPKELFPLCAHHFLQEGRRVALLPDWFVHESITQVFTPKEKKE